MLYIWTHYIQANLQTHRIILVQIFLELFQSLSQENELCELGKAHSPNTFFSTSLADYGGNHQFVSLVLDQICFLGGRRDVRKRGGDRPLGQ
jgi:hypothetical protein